jgi:hypothetical protein
VAHFLAGEWTRSVKFFILLPCIGYARNVYNVLAGVGMPRFIYSCVLCSVLLYATAAASGTWPLSHTARDVFTRMPDTIFENTPAGLAEDEKQDLLTKGSSEFWEVGIDTESTWELVALPFRDISVLLNVFHYSDTDAIVAAMGTRGSSVCTIELWREDEKGHIIPVEVPESPELKEFFQQQPDFAALGLDPMVMMCVQPGRLEASVVFWNNAGMTELSVDNTVQYYWSGKKFEKVVAPRKGKDGV